MPYEEAVVAYLYADLGYVVEVVAVAVVVPWFVAWGISRLRKSWVSDSRGGTEVSNS